MATIIRTRRDTAANWTTNDPVIPDGQECIDTTNWLLKVGDGIQVYSALPILNSSDVLAQITANAMQDLVEDTTPQLGGNLDINGFDIAGFATDAEVALKAPIASPTFTGTVTAATTLVSNDTYPQAADVSIATGTHTFDATVASAQQLTITGASTIAFTFTAGVVAAFIVDAVNWGAFAVTLPIGMIFDGGTAPTFTASGRDKLLVTHDKDNTLEMFVIGQGIA